MPRKVFALDQALAERTPPTAEHWPFEDRPWSLVATLVVSFHQIVLLDRVLHLSPRPGYVYPIGAPDLVRGVKDAVLEAPVRRENLTVTSVASPMSVLLDIVSEDTAAHRQRVRRANHAAVAPVLRSLTASTVDARLWTALPLLEAL
jgi:hypothetical protein